MAMQTIGFCGQPMRDPFRVVQPPMAVLVDLATLFPRQPHHVGGGYHAGGLQMHRVVEGRLSCWALCEHGHWWGLVTYAITFGPKSKPVTHWVPGWTLRRSQ